MYFVLVLLNQRPSNSKMSHQISNLTLTLLLVSSTKTIYIYIYIYIICKVHIPSDFSTKKKKQKSGAYTKLLSLESNLVSSSITTAKIYEFNANL